MRDRAAAVPEPIPDVERYLRAVLPHEALLRSFLRRYLKNPSDQEELLQDVYIRLLEAGAGSPSVEIRDPKAFALRVAHHLALDKLKRQRIVPIEFTADLQALCTIPDIATAIEDRVVAEQEFERVESAIARLPPRCRDIVVLRKIFGFSQKEIADHLGIAVSTVETQLMIGVKRLLELVGSRCEDHRGTNAPRFFWNRKSK